MAMGMIINNFLAITNDMDAITNTTNNIPNPLTTQILFKLSLSVQLHPALIDATHTIMQLSQPS